MKRLVEDLSKASTRPLKTLKGRAALQNVGTGQGGMQHVYFNAVCSVPVRKVENKNKQMTQSNLEQDTITFEAAISACEKAGEWRRSDNVLSDFSLKRPSKGINKVNTRSFGGLSKAFNSL